MDKDICSSAGEGVLVMVIVVVVQVAVAVIVVVVQVAVAEYLSPLLTSLLLPPPPPLREVVSQDIEDFEYTPKPQYNGPFTVKNLEGEEALLRFFIHHIQQLKPQVFVTYNGDNFDWPFIENRMRAYGMDMAAEIGVSESQGEYRGR